MPFSEIIPWTQNAYALLYQPGHKGALFAFKSERKSTKKTHPCVCYSQAAFTLAQKNLIFCSHLTQIGICCTRVNTKIFFRLRYTASLNAQIRSFENIQFFCLPVYIHFRHDWYQLSVFTFIPAQKLSAVIALLCTW